MRWMLLAGVLGCSGDGGGGAGDDDDDFGGDPTTCPDPDPAVDVVSVEEGQVYDLAADATHLYWADGEDYGLHRVAKSGGGAEELFAARGVAVVGQLALDDGYVYFPYGSFGPTEILRVPKGGGAEERVADVDQTVSAIAVDDVAVYVITGTDLVSIPKEGGPKTTLASVPGVSFGLTVADGLVWWTEFAGYDVTLYKVDPKGGTAEAVTSETDCQGQLRASGADLYCVSSDRAERIDRSSGAVTVLFQGVAAYDLWDITVTGGYAWTVGADEVRRVGIDGTGEELVSCGQNFPHDIVSDSAAVFVGNSGGPSVAETSGGIVRIDVP